MSTTPLIGSVVVAFAFGTGDIVPNRQIWDMAVRCANRLLVRAGSLIYTQEDVPIPPQYKGNIVCIDQEGGKPPSTLRIARGAVKEAQRVRASLIYVVAAQPHLHRALRDVRAAVSEANAHIGVEVCSGVLDYSTNSWFSPESGQPHTQSRKNWEQREWILMHMPFWLYKLVAS